jgi:hypothetical protein
MLNREAMDLISCKEKRKKLNKPSAIILGFIPHLFSVSSATLLKY